jgi:hypothetical protein
MPLANLPVLWTFRLEFASGNLATLVSWGRSYARIRSITAVCCMKKGCNKQLPISATTQCYVRENLLDFANEL